MEDEQIVQLFLNRDENAIEETSEKYGARLRAVSLAITSDIQTSEECENDTYMQAWESIPPNKPSTYLYAFLARIIRHISIDRCRALRSIKRDAFITELSEELENCIPASDDVASSFEAKELGKIISSYLGTVSAEKRVVFVRRYFYMDSISEISKRCAISDSKVKSILFRMRNDLSKYLLREGYTL